MQYRVEPGLYAVGNPTPDSSVLVSANYKLSFDHLRRALAGRDAWILVLDTDGINVWCAAGKGTFGTDELVRRVKAVRLDEVVGHRILVLPQLGAPGVSAHRVRAEIGFKVKYGPVRAVDVAAFLGNGMRATAAMRQVFFGWKDRLTVVPVEIVHWAKYHALFAVILWLSQGLARGGYSPAVLARTWQHTLAFAVASLFAGAVVVPALLPWIPGRLFSVKGAIAGLVAGVALELAAGMPGYGNGLQAGGWILLMTAVSSFYALNFTGSTPFTSRSGVRWEVRWAWPLEAVALLAGWALVVVSGWIS